MRDLHKLLSQEVKKVKKKWALGWELEPIQSWRVVCSSDVVKKKPVRSHVTWLIREDKSVVYSHLKQDVQRRALHLRFWFSVRSLYSGSDIRNTVRDLLRNLWGQGKKRGGCEACHQRSGDMKSYEMISESGVARKWSTEPWGTPVEMNLNISYSRGRTDDGDDLKARSLRSSLLLLLLLVTEKPHPAYYP